MLTIVTFVQFISSAAAYNHGRIVEVLLESGADPEAKDMMQMTPLLIAVTGGAVEAAKRLLDYGVDIKATDSSLNSCLHQAINYRRPEMVTLLLEKDKDRDLIEMKDKDMKTVIHLAAGLETSKVFLFCFIESLLRCHKLFNNKAVRGQFSMRK